MLGIRRREFITLLGGTTTWPVAALAQRGGIGRLGVLLRYADGDPEAKVALAGFRQGLKNRGWQEGGNLHIDYRLGVIGRPTVAATAAKELIGLRPDVIFTQGPTLVAALQRESRTTPIVFVQISDPIGSGFIATLARPGGNITGLLLFEASIAGKLLQMLKEIAPHVSRVALLMLGDNSFANYLNAVQAFASSLGINLVFTPVEDAEADISGAIESFARMPNGGLITPPDFVLTGYRELIVKLAARYRLPAVYSDRAFVKDGGLLSYGTDVADMYRQAAAYVDRILRGDKPADLPVQTPVKYETVLNLKTAHALDLTVPPVLLVAADEVLE
jgi:putative ABC transport system substrate-binding protein